MITWYRQPSPFSCGQTCVAMLTGITPDRVIESIPDDKGTIAKQLIDYLRALGWKTDERCKAWIHMFTNVPVGFTALCRVRWGVVHGVQSRRAHWVLLAEDKFWDPLARDPIFLRKGGRVLSYVRVERPA